MTFSVNPTGNLIVSLTKEEMDHLWDVLGKRDPAFAKNLRPEHDNAVVTNDTIYFNLAVES